MHPAFEKNTEREQNRKNCGIINQTENKKGAIKVVEQEETYLCETPTEKLIIVAEGFSNQDVAEEYRYLKKGHKTIGVRFFSDYGLHYPRNAVEVITDALRVHFAVTPLVIAVNPLTSFFRSVYGTRNEELTTGLFTLFYHRLFTPQAYLLSPTVDPELVDILESIGYPEPPVNLIKDVQAPVAKAFKLFEKWGLENGNFFGEQYV
jgi:hypothetical protein